MRYLARLLVTGAVIGLAWISRLPSKAECVASGRIVDPTERHCEFDGGFQQLQEHAMFHGTQIALGALLLLALAFGARWLFRRRSIA